MVLALVAALVAPFFIDWSVYRADFEREASRILGRHVVVEGEASARLLPFPSVTFSDVEVRNDAGEIVMTVKRFRMDAELAPYLSGEIRIFSMNLEEPNLVLGLPREGAMEWVFAAPDIPTSATVVLENITIEDGTIVVRNDRTTRIHYLRNVEAHLSARSLQGPLSGEGTLTADGHQLGFSISTGSSGEEGGLPLKVRLDAPEVDAGFVVDGRATMEEGLPQISGSLRVSSPLAAPAPATEGNVFGAAEPDEAATDRSDRVRPGGAVLPPVQATSTIEASADAVDLTDLRVSAGPPKAPYVLTGAGRLNIAPNPSFVLDLEGEQVDVDTLASGETESTAGAVGLDERLEAVRRVLAMVPRPEIPGTIQLSLPVVVVGDTTVREVSVAASPTDAGWSLARLSAELPGRTQLSADGTLDLGPRLRFKGDLLLASRQPAGFSSWLSGAVDPAVRGLNRAGFSAKVDLSEDAQIFNDLEVDVGGNTLKGSLKRSGASGQRALNARLYGGAANLDAIQAFSKLFTGQTDSLAEASRYNVAFSAGPVSYKGASARAVAAEFSYDGNRLSVSRLSVDDLAGSDLSASGELSGLRANPQGDLSISVESERPEAIIDFLSQRLPESPVLPVLARRAPSFGPLRLKARLRTDEHTSNGVPALRITVAGSAGGTRIDSSIALENGFAIATESGRYGVNLGLTNDDPPQLLTQLGFDALPVDVPAPLSLQLSLSGEKTGPAMLSAALRAPGSELAANGTVEISAEGIDSLEASLIARSEDFASWLLAGGGFLGQTADLSMPVDMTADISWYKGDWTLDGWQGSLAGVTVAGALRKTEEGPVTGDLRLSELSLPWLAELVYGRPPLDPDGGWSSAGFGSPFPLPDADLDLSVQRFDLGGASAVAGLSAHLSNDASQLLLSDAKGGIGTAEIAGSLALKNVNGVGGFSMTAKGSGIALDRLFLGQDDGSIPGTFGGEIALDATGQSYRAMLSAMTGAGEVEVRDAALPGIAPTMFGPIVAAADKEGFEISQRTVSAVVSGLDQGATVPVPSASSRFSVAGGIARFAPVTLQTDGGTLTLSGEVDLADAALQGQAQLALDAGDEKVEGADPLVDYTISGSLAAPRLEADVSSLANYLSVRRLEKEQERVEAMQEALQEKLRLRREVRFYRWRAGERDRLRTEAEAVAERERQALERQKAEEAAKAAAEEEDVIRKAIEDAERRSREAPSQPDGKASTPNPDLNFDVSPPSPVAPRPAPPAPVDPALPGVTNPLQF
ncbi:AsmA family protein [Consotaella salsifontis]|uniref:AsmA family protein n=1 Tax=Consotaella salsifontis TaxID=1365950 RepID=A0A1T4L1P7_9HYPH|nr:AsmA family protein [Consotaella salsifontis]